MDQRQEILKAYQTFAAYLHSIDVEHLQNQFTRQELNEFKTQLHRIELRSLPYEIGKITQRMKEEEYPELLGVHHYPLIREIDFLTDTEKLELDTFLVKHRVGEYVQSLWHVTRNEKKRKQLEQWLVEQGVLEERYIALCPFCGEGHMTSDITKAEKEELQSQLKIFQETSDWDLYTTIQKRMDTICMDCDEEFDLDSSNPDDIRYKTVFKLKMERDDRLDRV